MNKLELRKELIKKQENLSQLRKIRLTKNVNTEKSALDELKLLLEIANLKNELEENNEDFNEETIQYTNGKSR